MAIEEETKEEVNPDTQVPATEAPNPGDQAAGVAGPTPEAEVPVEKPKVAPENETAPDPATDQAGETDPDPKPVEEAAPEAVILSYGEKMVGRSFNPGGDPKVDKIKALCAEVIDLCNEPANLSAAKTDLYKTAVTQMIIAQMCAVKFITFKH